MYEHYCIMYEKIDMAYSYVTSSHIPSTLFFIIVCIERIYRRGALSIEIRETSIRRCAASIGIQEGCRYVWA